VIAIVTAFAVYALIQRNGAADQRDVARSRQIAASAQDELASDPERAVLLAQNAYSLSPTRQAEEALREATQRSFVRLAFRGHDGPVRSVAVSPDGHLVATGGDDGTIRLWTPGDPGRARIMAGHLGAVNGLAFVRDLPATLVSGESDGTVRFWDTASGRELRRIQASTLPVRSVSVSVDGSVVAAGGDDKLVRVWRGDGDKPLELRGSVARIRTVALDPGGTLVAGAGGENPSFVGIDVWLWDATTGRLVSRQQDHNGAVYAMSFSPDGSRLATVSQANELFLRNRRGTTVTKITPPGVPQTAVAFGANGSVVASGGADGRIRLWEAASARQIVVLASHAGPVTSVAFVPGSELVISTSVDGSARVWDWRAALPRRFATQEADAAHFADSGGKRADWLDYNAAIHDWQPDTGRTAEVRPPDPTETLASAMDRNGDVVVAVGNALEVRPHAGGGQRPVRIDHLPAEAFRLAIGSDGRWVASSDVSGGLGLWHVGGSTASQALLVHGQPALSLAIGPDGALAAGFDDGTLVLRASPADPPRTVRASAQRVSAVAFTPDGRWVASGSRDGDVRIWEVATGAPGGTLHEPAAVTGVEFSADGATLEVASADEARVWDWRRGVTLARFTVPGAVQASVSDDGSRVLVRAQDGLAVWPCDVCGSVQAVRSLSETRVTRALTEEEKKQFLEGA
jgi:WD40 repeat protein